MDVVIGGRDDARGLRPGRTRRLRGGRGRRDARRPGFDERTPRAPATGEGGCRARDSRARARRAQRGGRDRGRKPRRLGPSAGRCPTGDRVGARARHGRSPDSVLHAGGARERRGRRSGRRRLPGALPRGCRAGGDPLLRRIATGRANRVARVPRGLGRVRLLLRSRQPARPQGARFPDGDPGARWADQARPRQGHARQDGRLPAGHRARRLRGVRARSLRDRVRRLAHARDTPGSAAARLS